MYSPFYCKIFIALFSFSLFTFYLTAQPIPDERTTHWEMAGSQSIFPEKSVIINAEKWGFVGDGITNNDKAWTNLLANFSNEPLTIQFPEGVFHFEHSIVCRSFIQIIGVSPEQTVFRFTSSDDGILIQGEIEDKDYFLTNNAYKNNNYLEIDANYPFHKGDFIRLFFDDKNFVTSTWANNCVGQIIEVEKVSKSLIFTKTPLRMDYLTAQNARFQALRPISNVCIKSVKIQNSKSSSLQSGNIRFKYAVNCWLENIESENCNYAHLIAEYSSNLSIRNCYFHHAHSYGNGGKGYGIAFQFTTNECLVENNVFQKLRHAMLVQAGANANVFAYNYSIEPYWTGVKLPKNAAGDIVLHGNYPFLNLFEGNIVQSIVVDKSHGMNGPFNTFFRNRAELYGIFMVGKSNAQNFINNEITNQKFLYGLFILKGKGHFVQGNLIKHKQTTHSIVSNWSLYYKNIPDFLKQYENMATSIPAKDRIINEK